MPAGAYQTFRLSAPITTHRRRASCAEVHCPAHERGWATTVAAGSRDEHAIRTSGRHFLVPEILEGGFVRFTFTAGQPCFKAGTHTAPVEREPLYLVVGGDFRGNPTGYRYQHAGAADWVDQFANHQDRIARHTR